ncbi:MAG: CBS domain-containing protein [Calothrix sp. SM1_5_4]|nr:CBS domain-containing protein [Calothrix sp. SM1_5_4]
MTKIAQDIMSKELITVSMNESVLNAYRTMQKHRIRHLPVTDESAGLVGILSDRDIQKCIRFDRKSKSQHILDIELNLDPTIKVADAMSWPIHKVQGDISVRDVALRMLNEKISSMLVECPQTGKRGIITTDDLIRLLISMLDKDPGRLRLAVGSIIEDFVSA